MFNTKEFKNLIVAFLSFFKLNKNCFTPSRAGSAKGKTEDVEAFKRDLQNKLTQIVSQITKEEEEYRVEQNIHRQASHCVFVRPVYSHTFVVLMLSGVFQVEEELIILESKASPVEGITKENMETRVSQISLNLCFLLFCYLGNLLLSEPKFLP